MPVDLLLHTNVQQAVTELLLNKPHATLLLGPSGAGKRTLARHISNRLLGSNATSTSAYYNEIAPDKSITIEQVRLLTKFLLLKVPGTAAIRRVAVLLHADTMTIEAQNALLKLLEEPPDDTMLLLTAEQAHSLLPTIRSRVQTIQVTSATKQQASTYFTEKGSSTAEIERAYSISAGQIGLMSAMLAGGADHELAQDIIRAKDLLQLSNFERLTQVDLLAKNKEDLPNLLLAFKRIAQSALNHAADNQNAEQTQSWHARLSCINSAERALNRNANTKLLLTDLFMTL